MQRGVDIAQGSIQIEIGVTVRPVALATDVVARIRPTGRVGVDPHRDGLPFSRELVSEIAAGVSPIRHLHADGKAVHDVGIGQIGGDPEDELRPVRLEVGSADGYVDFGVAKIERADCSDRSGGQVRNQPESADAVDMVGIELSGCLQSNVAVYRALRVIDQTRRHPCMPRPHSFSKAEVIRISRQCISPDSELVQVHDGRNRRRIRFDHSPRRGRIVDQI